jgi:Ca2+-binding RTX toxin-like protein
MNMTPRKILSLMGALAALGMGVATLAQAQSADCSQPDPAYCPANTNSDDPAPQTPPAVQPPAAGEAPEVAGTLTGGTQTVEVTNSSNTPGTADIQVNLAGTGTLVIKSGDQTITIAVDGDGNTTIDPGDGSDPIQVSGSNGAPGTIEIKITPEGVTYTLKAPGTKTVKVGDATATVPGTATITRTAGQTTYNLHGKGDCNASLDPAVANHFNADKNIACVIDEGGANARALRAYGKSAGADIIRTGNRRDRISAGVGKDIVRSNGGNDVVHGNSNTDTLYGGAGNDRLFGDGSNDHIYGGSGNDQISGGDGRDYVDGGAGNDVIFNKAHGLDTIKCGSGRDVVYAGPLDKVAADCEVVHRPAK